MSTVSTGMAAAYTGRCHVSESSNPYGPQGEFLHLFLQMAKNITDGEKMILCTMRIFASCTILDKEQECNAPLHPCIHPLKVFVQDPFPLGGLICEANDEETVLLRAVFAHLWFILDLPIHLNSQKVTQWVVSFLSAFPLLGRSIGIKSQRKVLQAPLH